jgi:hypothetical protein
MQRSYLPWPPRTGRINPWSQSKDAPQGLKPQVLCGCCGTTEELAEKVCLAAWKKGPWLKPR